MKEREYEPLENALGTWHWFPQPTHHYYPHEIPPELVAALGVPDSFDGYTYPTREAALDALGAARAKAGGGDARAELLAACKRMLSVWVEVVTLTCAFSEAATVEREVRAAIAKAEAES